MSDIEYEELISIDDLCSIPAALLSTMRQISVVHQIGTS